MREPITLYTATSLSGLLANLQVLFSGLHALDVLALKNDLHHYHLYMERIPEYVNMLENAQKLSKRSGNLITEETLLLIAKNAMLSTEHLPRADENWEDLPKKMFWTDWKNLYKAADRKAKVKKQAVGGQYQFGTAHSALR